MNDVTFECREMNRNVQCRCEDGKTYIYVQYIDEKLKGIGYCEVKKRKVVKYGCAKENLRPS